LHDRVIDIDISPPMRAPGACIKVSVRMRQRANVEPVRMAKRAADNLVDPQFL
jgi:hypothetical protein